VADASFVKVFFGAAIQGVQNRGGRAEVYRYLIDTIKGLGHTVVTEHSAAKDYPSTLLSLEQTFGKLPADDEIRRRFVRDKMIECVEGDIDAIVFEVSTPSLGTGIEIAHAYLRPRLGLKAVPILALYEAGYWPHHLSSMVRGISPEKVPLFRLKDYGKLEEAGAALTEFLALTDRGR
jgi:hypothetical protein